MNPRTEALAYRIWAFAKAREWNVTTSDLADALDVDRHRVSRVVGVKGWMPRLRSTEQDTGAVYHAGNHNGLSVEARGVSADALRMMGVA